MFKKEFFFFFFKGCIHPARTPAHPQALYVPHRCSLCSWHAVQKPELCPRVPQKSLTTICVCAEVVENVACLSQGVSPGLSQGLVGRARWSGWGCRPPPPPTPPLTLLPPLFNRRSNTVANVMCNKTHFHCPLLRPSEWAQSVGNGRYRTHREVADGKPLCTAGLKRWPRLLWQEFRALRAASGRGTCLCTHLLIKRRPPPQPFPPSPPACTHPHSSQAPQARTHVDKGAMSIGGHCCPDEVR